MCRCDQGTTILDQHLKAKNEAKEEFSIVKQYIGLANQRPKKEAKEDFYDSQLFLLPQ